MNQAWLKYMIEKYGTEEAVREEMRRRVKRRDPKSYSREIDSTNDTPKKKYNREYQRRRRERL